MSTVTRKNTPRRSRADAVYDKLKQDIGEFRLVPGDRFTENEVSAQLGVSRTPAREALFRLQQEGLVEVLFRNGWRVRPFDFGKVEELYDLRVVLETAAVRSLCSDDVHAKRDLIDGIEPIWLVPVSARCSDVCQVAQWDEEFHCNLVAAAGNAEMARVYRDVTERIRSIRRLDFTQPLRIDVTYEEHAGILRALRRKRADQAALLLQTHIRTSLAEVRKITVHQVHMARRRA